MKSGTLLDSTQTIPKKLHQEITEHLPEKQLSDLTIRYYNSLEDVGHEFFNEKILPACIDNPLVCYLEPFISYGQLGETLILSQNGLVVYDNEENPMCTETGPFWFVTVKDSDS